MYAVIKSGGKQYRVSEGQTLRLEKLLADEGGEIAFEEVLMVANGDDYQVGSPLLSGIKVLGTIVNHGRGKKIRIIKMKRRKHHMKRQGHRQYFTAVKIHTIDTGKAKASTKKNED